MLLRVVRNTKLNDFKKIMKTNYLICALCTFSCISLAQTTTRCSDDGIPGSFTCYSKSPESRNNDVDLFDSFTRGVEATNQRAYRSQEMDLQIQQMQQLQNMQRLQQQQQQLQIQQQQYQQQLQQRSLNSLNTEAQRAQIYDSKSPTDLIHIENSFVANHWVSFFIHQISKFKNDKLQGAKFTLVFGALVNWNYDQAIKQIYVVDCKKSNQVFLVLGSNPNGSLILNSHSYDLPAETSAGKSAISACKRI
jgi:TolA-binding protein